LRQRILCFLILMVSFSCKTLQKDESNVVRKTSDFFYSTFYKQANVQVPDKDWDPLLAPYASQFVSDAAAIGVIIPQSTIDMLKLFIYTDNMSVPVDPGVMAACTRYYTYELQGGEEVKVKWMNIEVLRKESAIFTQGQQPLLKELLYHELFHCFMDKGHLPAPYNGIMSPTLDSNNQAVFTNFSGLFQEMFSPQFMQLTPNAS